MPDYYIRTPDHEESRGPFDPAKLQTLAEAGQVTENTLYYDDDKEEWLPIALNEALKNQVFPQREKLSLKARRKKSTEKRPGDSEETEDDDASETATEQGGLQVESMLAAAEGDTEETRHLKRKEKSFQRAAAVATPGLGLMMLLSAAVLLVPHFTTISEAVKEGGYATVINYPFLLVGLFDVLMAIFLFLAVTEIYPLLRGRAMLTFGFGVYLGWAIGDPILAATAAAGGLGIFLATVSRSYPVMLLAILLGLGGNGYLAYLALVGRFTGFFEGIEFDIISAD